jgi:hypothetical protein
VRTDWPCYRLPALLAHPGSRHGRLTPCAQPCSARPLILQHDSRMLSTWCNVVNANHIHQPGPPMRNNCQSHHMAQAWPICMHCAFASARPERARYWLVADCRTALSDVAVLPVIRLHRDAASRTILADRLEGLRWDVASMSCLVVCSEQHSASQGVLRK